MPRNLHSFQIPLSSSTGIFILFFFILTIYSNTFNASWHLDDYPNILKNKRIQLTELSISSLFESFQLSENSLNYRLVRPVSFISLALNWYVGNQQVIGYHIVNISIHILTAVFLYLFLLSLLGSPRLVGCFKGKENNIALLATVLWAIHPIQTQAITYIVQRMASLAAMFYILCLFFYIRGRFQIESKPRLAFYAGSFLCMLLAVGSKENTITLPLSIGLIEIFFFQDLTSVKNRKTCIRIAIFATIATVALGVFLLLFVSSDPFSTFKTLSDKRSFSPTERLLTQPRVVINYLIQIFYPLLDKFSIEHPITISTSLFEPLTTLMSLLTIVALLIFALLGIKNFPVLSLAILFYFINHVVESSFISLELVFEHRNYLPSFFLFLPVAIGVVSGLHYFIIEKKRAMFLLCFSAMTFLLVVLGISTFIRNEVWGSEKSLWEDAVKKAPLSARPWSSLAFYYNSIGYYDKALELYEISLTKQRLSGFFPAVVLRNIGYIYSIRQDYKKALEYFDRALTTDPNYSQALFDKASVLSILGEWKTSKNAVETLISKGNATKDDYYLMGIISLKINEPEKALQYFRMANQVSPFDHRTYVHIGISLSMMGHHNKADWFLRQASLLAPDDLIPLIYRVDNLIKINNITLLNEIVINLLTQFHLQDIQEKIILLSHNNMWVTISTDAIATLISSKLKIYSDNMLHLYWKQYGQY